jgi:4-hydroxybenzoate polyprenyltransferase
VRSEVGGAVVGRLTAYAELVRLPNLFTAPPDVVAGAALAAAVGGSTVGGRAVADGVEIGLPAVAGLAAASVLLYAAGTTLNDYFDAGVDAEERPDRPIPSGRVPRARALALGIGLLVGGVGVAWASGGVESGAVAAGVALVVLAYDGLLKGGSAGFLAMGAARGLNVTLGLTAGASLTEVGPLPFAVPLVVAGYIAAVTYMAADEATAPRRGPVAVAAVAAVGAVAAVPLTLIGVGAGPASVAVGLGTAIVFLGGVVRPLRRAYADPSPVTVGPAVGACVLGLIVLDAAFAAVGAPAWTVATVAFALPAAVLSRAFDVT